MATVQEAYSDGHSDGGAYSDGYSDGGGEPREDTRAPRDWQNCTWSYYMYNCSDIGRMDEWGNYYTGYPPGIMCRTFGCEDLMYAANGTFVPLWKGCPAACAEFQ